MLENTETNTRKTAPYPTCRLVAALKAKQAWALSQLYDHYSPALYGSILRIVRQNDSAEEVLQDVFFSVWRHIDTYDSQKGSLFTWMLNIARNKSIDSLRLRQNKYDRCTDALEGARVKHSINPYRLLDTMDLQKHISALCAADKVILELVFFRGFTCREAAQLLKLPEGTVKTNMRRAYKILRTQLSASYSG